MPPGRLPVLMTGGISRATCLPHGHSRAYFFFFCFLRWKQQCKPEYGPQQAPDYKPPPPPLRTPPRSGSRGLEAGGLYTPDEGLSLGRAHSLACSITVMVTASKYPAWHLLVSTCRVSGEREPWSSQGCPPLLQAPSQATGLHGPPLSPQTPPAGATPEATFMPSLFSCSRLFDNF